MAKSKEQKLEMGKDITKRMVAASASIVAEYRGLSAEDLASFRKDLRKVGCEFRVVKNRVAKFAIDDVEGEDRDKIKSLLKGPLGVVYVNEDVAQGAKHVIKFSKEKKGVFNVTGGVMDGQFISLEDVQRIAALPSKDTMMASIVGSLVAPHRGILGVLSGVPAKLVRTIAAIRDTKSE